MSWLRITFLGTGTSTGLPMINCECPTCLSEDPRDQRLRASILIQTPEVQLIVDTGPDFRTQALRARIKHLDAVLLSHPHSDHILGFDDLRRFTVEENATLDVFGSEPTLEAIRRIFPFMFTGKSRFRGYFKPELHAIHGPFQIGDLEIRAYDLEHGNVVTSGFLFLQNGVKKLFYASDCKRIPETTMNEIHGVQLLVLDALRYTPHPTHLSLPEALEVVKIIQPQETYLTHFHCEIQHAKVEPTLPTGVRLSYDTLQIQLSDEVLAP